MRRVTALVILIAIVATGCSDDAKPTAGDGPKTTNTPSSEPSEPPEPGIKPGAAAIVMQRYLATIGKANGKLDPKTAAQVETGSALQVHSAQYAVYKRNKLRYAKVNYTDGIAGAPKVSGYPKWFFAAATDEGSKPATRDFLLLVQEKKGAPWLVTYGPYSRTAKGPVAPGVDLADHPPVVAPDDKRVAIEPGKLAGALVHFVTHGEKSPYAARFSPGRQVDSTKQTLVDNRKAFAGDGWTGSSRAVAAKTPVYAARTKNGGALVWFALDLQHDYQSTKSKSGITWQTSGWGDLHKGFGVPSKVRSTITRVERSELVAYVPPRNKGKVHIIAGRWFPLSIEGR